MLYCERHKEGGKKTFANFGEMKPHLLTHSLLFQNHRSACKWKNNIRSTRGVNLPRVTLVLGAFEQGQEGELAHSFSMSDLPFIHHLISQGDSCHSLSHWSTFIFRLIIIMRGSLCLKIEALSETSEFICFAGISLSALPCWFVLQIQLWHTQRQTVRPL